MLEVLVTGATGTVGSRVVSALAARPGVRVRAAVRSLDRAQALPQGGQVQPVVMDQANPASVAAAMQGVQRVFLLTPFSDDQVALGKAAVDAAAAAGVEHVVKLSTSGADFEPGILLGRWHREVESHLEGSGMAWTHLRPGAFMSNFITYHRPDPHGNIFLPLDQAASSFVDPRDIAEVAAEVLTSDGHAGKAYTLTGPEPVSVSQAAEIISQATGKPVRYVPVPAEAASAAMEQMGTPAWMVQGLGELYGIMRAGWTAGVSPAVRELTGRPAGDFAQFARDHAAAW